MSSDRIVGYTYDTENLCPECTLESVMMTRPHPDVEKCLDEAAKILGIDRMEEKTFDTSTFPKVIFDYQIEDYERCGHCNEGLI